VPEDYSRLRPEDVQRIIDYASVFETPSGERVLEDLKRFCYWYRTTLVPGQPDESSANEGMRRVVVQIERMIRIAHDPLFSEAGVEGMKTDG